MNGDLKCDAIHIVFIVAQGKQANLMHVNPMLDSVSRQLK